MWNIFPQNSLHGFLPVRSSNELPCIVFFTFTRFTVNIMQPWQIKIIFNINPQKYPVSWNPKNYVGPNQIITQFTENMFKWKKVLKIRHMIENLLSLLRDPLFPIGSILKDLGLFNRPCGHFVFLMDIAKGGPWASDWAWQKNNGWGGQPLVSRSRSPGRESTQRLCTCLFLAKMSVFIPFFPFILKVMW